MSPMFLEIVIKSKEQADELRSTKRRETSQREAPEFMNSGG